jgi:serine/threonine protein kinase
VIARLKNGQVLEEKYTILRQIGGGGMGIVYEAEHIALNVRVAVKVLHPTEADDPDVLARFKAEARSAAGIRHRNVVEVTDFGLTPDRRPFFVMEYLKGESLADRLDKRKALSEREAVEITDQILCGLVAAHKKGIIHRDLKPENVWLARGEDGAETVKILDFGIAKIVGSALSNHIATMALEDRPQTQRGVVLGTPGYMAPESITVGGSADARSDLFAVGVLLYEMIVGRRPFNGVTVHEIMMATATAPVPQPSAIQPEISAPMERLILTSLAKKPDDRFQTAEEFLYHLTATAVGRIPDGARPCMTRVGLPSVMPPAALKRVKHGLPDIEPDPLRRSEAGTRQRSLSETRPGRARELSRSATTRQAFPAYPPPATAKKKKTLLPRYLPISPLALFFLAGLGIAFYVVFLRDGPWREIKHEEDILVPRAGTTTPYNLGTPVAEPRPALPDTGVANGETVTIWLDVDPFEALVTVDGTPVSERPLVVPKSSTPISVRATSPRMSPLSVDIVPNRDRSVVLHLRREAKNR